MQPNSFIKCLIAKAINKCVAMLVRPLLSMGRREGIYSVKEFCTVWQEDVVVRSINTYLHEEIHNEL